MTPLVQVCAADRVAFGRRPVIAQHDLHRCRLFEDAALIDLLDDFPREHLYVFAMGSDPGHPEENRLVVNRGVSGAALLRAVKSGRLWLNVTRIDRADDRFRLLIDDLYAGLATQVPGFAPHLTQGTLLISSPRALVYYHVDGPASALWHIRGRKRVWVYPALDTRFVEQEALEDIFAGARHEYLPFQAAFDAAAWVCDLEPGQCLTWAQNAPHRVMNLDGLNVSLSTEHFTRGSRSRARVYSANRFFRTRFGLRDLSTNEAGVVAAAKTVVHWMARRTGLDRGSSAKRHVATLRIDANAADGVAPLEAEAGS